MGMFKSMIKEFMHCYRYGFHSNHCKEALMATSGDVGAAFEFLMTRYMSLDSYDPAIEVAQALVDERIQELDSLRSIYEDCCEERIANQLWIVHLDLPYLANLYCDKQTELQQEENCDNKIAGVVKQNKESVSYTHLDVYKRQ